MATGKELMDAIASMEHQFRYNGMWQPASHGVPKLKIDKKWDDESKLAGEALNRMMVIMMITDCARFFGAVRESTPDAFTQDFLTGPERMHYVTTVFNRLRADIGMLPRIDLGAIPKLET
jgi:hypothetical protein